MGLTPQETLSGKLERLPAKLVQTPAECHTWTSGGEEFQVIKKTQRHLLKDTVLIPHNQERAFYVLYTDDQEFFGFYFPILSVPARPNCVVCVKWDPFVSPEENLEHDLVFLRTTAANITKIDVIPFSVLDKNMDGIPDEEQEGEGEGEGEEEEEEEEKKKTILKKFLKLPDAIKTKFGNFFKWSGKYTVDSMKTADVVFMDKRGALHPLSWQDIREKFVRRDNMINEAVKVLILHDKKNLLPAFLTRTID